MDTIVTLPTGDPLHMFVQRMVHGFLGSLALYLAAWHNLDMLKDRFFPNRINYMDTYDFIVVGAGTSGAVVASRLSENFKVLLLEAGGDPFPPSSVPGFSTLLLNYPEIDWRHETVPQGKACFGLTGNRSILSQGRGLGGTTNINSLVQSRGSPLDYNHWAEVTGDPEWEYDKVVPFFKRAENHQGDVETDYCGKGGPINIGVSPYPGSGEVFVNAAMDLGYKQVDMFGPFTEGFDLARYALKRGRRQGTFQSYIRPIRRRPSLTIGKFSLATRLIFREDGNEVMGVEYTRHGRRRKAFATKEVIVSAGALQSPKLLMQSGIGPAGTLQAFGIPMRANSEAVGQNLQDHLGTYVGPFFVNDELPIPILQRDISSFALSDFMYHGSGVLTTSGAMALGFISSELAKARGESNWPDIKLVYLGVGIPENWGSEFSHAFNYNYDDARKYFSHAAGKSSFMIHVSLARPKSRGEVTLKSGDSADSLYIDPKYLNEDEDFQVLVSGVKKAVQIVEESETFRKYEANFTSQPIPGCENKSLKSDEYWQCYVKRMTIGSGHLGGTCVMGKHGSKDAVVDREFNVIGVQRLRVIDASIMPTLPVGGTSLPAVMLGERGAFFIKRAWQVTEVNTTTTTRPMGPSPSILTTGVMTTPTTPRTTVSSSTSTLTPNNPLSSNSPAVTVSTPPPSSTRKSSTPRPNDEPPAVPPNRQLRPVLLPAPLSDNPKNETAILPSRYLPPVSSSGNAQNDTGSVSTKYLPPLQCKYGYCGNERSEETQRSYNSF